MSNRVLVDAVALNALCEEAAHFISLRQLAATVRNSVTAEPDSTTVDSEVISASAPISVEPTYSSFNPS